MRFLSFAIVFMLLFNVMLPANNAHYIVSGQGIGAFTLGVSLQEIRKKLEHPELLVEDSQETQQGVKTYKYTPVNIYIKVDSKKEQVEELSAADANMKTYGGNGVGSTLVEITKEYGKDYIKVGPHIIYFNRGIAFTFNVMKVNTITVFLVGSEVDRYYRQGMAELQVGDALKAEQLFQKLLAIEEQNIKGYVGLGIAYMKQETPFLAVRSFEKAISLDSKYLPAYHGISALYIKYGKYEEAVKAYNQAIEMVPGDLETYIALGNLYMDLSKADLAIDIFKKAIKLEPQNYTALIGLGVAYELRGDKTEAAKTYRKIITAISQLDPEKTLDLEMRIKVLEQ